MRAAAALKMKTAFFENCHQVPDQMRATQAAPVQLQPRAISAHDLTGARHGWKTSGAVHEQMCFRSPLFFNRFFALRARPPSRHLRPRRLCERMDPIGRARARQAPTVDAPCARGGASTIIDFSFRFVMIFQFR